MRHDTGSTSHTDQGGEPLAAYRRGDYATAFRLFRSLAEKGNAEAQNNLGLMYESGLSVRRDYKEAARFYELAAKQGNTDAMENLAYMYELGRGVPQDDMRAYMWLIVATDDDTEKWDNPITVGVRDDIAKRLTQAQIELAQEIAQKCLNSHYTICD